MLMTDEVWTFIILRKNKHSFFSFEYHVSVHGYPQYEKKKLTARLEEKFPESPLSIGF